MRRLTIARLRVAAIGLAAFQLGPAQARAAAPAPDPAIAASLEELRAEDVRVASVAFRLATHATAYCKRIEPLTGMLVQDLTQFARAYRPTAAALFHLEEAPAVEAVLPDSPAARAGVRANDVLRSIDDTPVEAILAPAARRKSANFDRMSLLLAALDAAQLRGPVRLGLARDGRPLAIEVTGRPGCASMVQLVPSSKQNAGADGRIVTLSTAILANVADDDELAFLIGHEMSHNILGHMARLEGEGVSFGLFAGLGANAARIRATEEEADYLGIYVMAAAGYDPAAAARFWTRFEAAHGFGILADATHLNGARRIRFLERTAREVRARQQAGQPLTPDIDAAVRNARGD